MPSNWASRSSRFSAMKSTTFNSTASRALKDEAFLTVSSSLSWLRPRSWAMLRIRAAASFSTLLARVSPKSCPPEATGVAAPILVPGAITAKLAAAVMKVPAEPALAPLGETYTATGTRASNSSSTMSLVEERRPPGVSSSMTTRVAPSSSACSRAREMKRSFTGLMMPSTLSSNTWGA